MRYYSSTAGAYTLATSCSNTATSMDVSSTAGMPSQFPFTLVVDVGTTAEEIITVTNVAGTSLTVARGQDGSPAQAHQAGAVVRHMATARDFREPQQHIDATVAHGRSSALVAVDDPQTLKNKTFDGSNVVPQAAVTGLTTALTDVVYRTAAQTLTGKTISGASNTLTNIPKSALPGDILYSGSGATFTFAALDRSAATAFGTSGNGMAWASGDVVSDNSGMWSSANPGRLTAPSTGVYLLHATGSVAPNGFDNDTSVNVYKNGTLLRTSGTSASGTFQQASVSMSMPLALTAGDYVEVAFNIPSTSTGGFSVTLIKMA